MWPELEIGMSGPQVKALQYLLNNRAAELYPHGDFDSPTENAVRALQVQLGLFVTGTTTTDTWLGLARSIGPGETGDAIRAAQTLLISVGFMFEESGDFDAEMLAGLRAFSLRFSPTDNGDVIRLLTWQALLTARPIEEVFNTLATALESLSRQEPQTNWFLHQPDANVSHYVPLVGDSSWVTLDQVGASDIEEALTLAEEAKSSIGVASSLAPILAQVRNYVDVPIYPLTARADWNDLSYRLIRGLEDRGEETSDAERLVAELTALKLSDIIDDLTGHVTALLTDRDRMVRGFLAAAAGAYLAQSIARFNLALDAPVNIPPQAETIAAELGAAEEAVRSAFVNVPETGYRPGRLVEAAEMLQGVAIRALKDAPIVAASAVSGWEAQRIAERGRAAVEATELVRRAVAAVSLAHYTAWLSALDPGWPLVYDWINAASLPLNSPSPLTVTIAELLNNPANYTASAFVVEGATNDVNVSYASGAALTKLALEDEGRRVEVWCAGDLVREGLIGGLWCQLVGTVDTTGQAPVVKDLPVSPATDRPTSFLAFARRRLTNVFRWAPSGRTIRYSWRGGICTGTDLLAFGAWFEREE